MSENYNLEQTDEILEEETTTNPSENNTEDENGDTGSKIGTDDIADGAVTSDKISNRAVSRDKLSDALIEEINNLSLDAEEFDFIDVLPEANKGNYFYHALTGQKYESGKYQGAHLDVMPGEVYRISAKAADYNYCVQFYSRYNSDSDFKLLSQYGTLSTVYHDEIFTVPKGATHMGVCSHNPNNLEEYNLKFERRVPINLKSLKEEQKKISVEQIATLPQYMSLPAPVTARAICVDGKYLYHSGNNTYFEKITEEYNVNTDKKLIFDCTKDNESKVYKTGHCYSISKTDISVECVPELKASKVGGHALPTQTENESEDYINNPNEKKPFYPRNMSMCNGYLYVPYREETSGSASKVRADIGGYLDIINLTDSEFKCAKTITYSRQEFSSDEKTDNNIPNDTDMYFGKCGYTATCTYTYTNPQTNKEETKRYLCLTQQMGGWRLYDITNDPTLANPESEIYYYDNRVASYTDNHGDNEMKGFLEFQQPVFFEKNGVLYLAIAGYDKNLVTIYDISNTDFANLRNNSDNNVKIEPVFEYNIRNFVKFFTKGEYDEYIDKNMSNMPNDKNEEDKYKKELRKKYPLLVKYLHTLGITYRDNYLYCTIAPEPNALKDGDTLHTFEGVAVIDVSDMNNIKVSVFQMPKEDNCEVNTGEPSPSSIAVNSRHLVMDNAEKGISIWSLENPAQPRYLGCLNTGETVCSVYMTDDGRTFAGNKDNGNITMFRGL